MNTVNLELDDRINEEVLIRLALEEVDMIDQYYTASVDDQTSFVIDEEAYLIMENLLEYYKYMDELQTFVDVQKDNQFINLYNPL